MKLYFPLFTILCFSIISCAPLDPNKEVDEGHVKDDVYTSAEVGWTIEIPKGWTVVSRDKMEANEEKGVEAIEESSGIEIDTKKLKHLISFQKNQFNLFTSTSEPYTEDFPGEYDQTIKEMGDMIYNTFDGQGIKVDTATGAETIQGLKFWTLYTTIYSPEGDVILRQIIYSRLINGYSFGANINYNNEEDKETMLDAWEKSKFK